MKQQFFKPKNLGLLYFYVQRRPSAILMRLGITYNPGRSKLGKRVRGAVYDAQLHLAPVRSAGAAGLAPLRPNLFRFGRSAACQGARPQV